MRCGIKDLKIELEIAEQPGEKKLASEVRPGLGGGAQISSAIMNKRMRCVPEGATLDFPNILTIRVLPLETDELEVDNLNWLQQKNNLFSKLDTVR